MLVRLAFAQVRRAEELNAHLNDCASIYNYAQHRTTGCISLQIFFDAI